MNRKGFTLVEIMIVVAIIALLAAIAIPNLLRPRVAANDANAKATLRTISTALETYAAANDGDYATSVTTLYNATPRYINKDYVADCTNATPCQGFYFTCGTLSTTAYSCTATPATCNSTGTKTFTVTTGGLFTDAGC